jgi:hypothetical protein
LDSSFGDGSYVYVQDVGGVVHVLPDGPHLHPRVLGNAESALYAGDLRIEDGRIVEVTNCSGTFEFDDVGGLWDVVDELLLLGFEVDEDAVVWWSTDGSSRPSVIHRDD